MTDTLSAAPPLPRVASLLAGQIRYQIKLLLSSGRTVAIGVGFPVILLISSSAGGHVSDVDVARYAVFGLTLTAWNIHGVRLVGARETGVLKRWRATPLPRWCYFVARIIGTVIVSILAGAAAVLAGVVLYNTHVTLDAALGMLVVFALGAAAWAAAATALTTVVPTVDAASSIFILVYFPTVIISGVMGGISEPRWLKSVARYLPAQPLVDASKAALHRTPGAAWLPGHDLLVLAVWIVVGLALAVSVFRWEPHRPTQKRAARPGR